MPGIAERLLYRVAKRWIAGYTMDDAIHDAQETNQKKMSAIVNRLGEHTPDQKLVMEYTEEYLKLLDRLDESHVNGCISVKPSQLGLTKSPELYRGNLQKILERAVRTNRTVWVDMENTPYTENTIRTYQDLHSSYKDLGLCIQANLKRTKDDLDKLLADGGKVRLVKGAYPESSDVAYKKKKEVDENYLDLLETLFTMGTGFVVGTHDDKLIDRAENLVEENPNVDFEFQFLKGIRDDLKERLVSKDYRVGEYIPYGPEWYNYSKRRIRERKRNILLLLRSITG